MIQLIAMDMDGTLLTPPPIHITENTIAVLKKASEQGIKLVLASGRPADDAGTFARNAGLDMAVIALNGSCMTLHPFDNLICVHHLKKDSGIAVLRHLLEQNAFFGMFCDHDLYVHELDPLHPMPDMIWGTYLAEGRGQISRDECDAWAFAERGISKFVVVDLLHSDMLAKIRPEIEHLAPELTYSSSWKDNLEINPAGVSKGSALRELCSMLFIPMDDVMAIGDNSNDLSMLNCCGYPVAMGNATQDVLAACPYHTLRNTEDGVAAAISKLALKDSQTGGQTL